MHKAGVQNMSLFLTITTLQPETQLNPNAIIDTRWHESIISLAKCATVEAADNLAREHTCKKIKHVLVMPLDNQTMSMNDRYSIAYLRTSPNPTQIKIHEYGPDYQVQYDSESDKSKLYLTVLMSHSELIRHRHVADIYLVRATNPEDAILQSTMRLNSRVSNRTITNTFAEAIESLHDYTEILHTQPGESQI